MLPGDRQMCQLRQARAAAGAMQSQSFSRCNAGHERRKASHESIASILWKLVLTNRLPGHLVALQLRTNVDPCEGVLPRPDSVVIRRLSDMLEVKRKVIRRSVVNNSEHRKYCSYFKYCRLCLGHGYHCVLFQRENETFCPAHNVSLETVCRSCGRESLT